MTCSRFTLAIASFVIAGCSAAQPPIGAPESESDAFANLAPRDRVTLPVLAVSMLLLVGGCGNRSSASHASVSKSNNEASSYERDLSCFRDQALDKQHGSWSAIG